MTPLAITGVGVVSPLGSSLEDFSRGLSGIFDPTQPVKPGTFHPPTMFDPSAYPGAVVAEVTGFDPTPVLGDKGIRNLDRLTRFFLVGTRRVFANAKIKQDGQFVHYTGHRVGICASTAYGSLEAMMELNRVAVLENPRYVNPARFPNTVINSALGYVSIWESLRAVNTTVCNGNSGALETVLLAETYLSSRRADAMVIGGAEAMHEALFLAFDRLGAMCLEEGMYAPGSARSTGMRLGEGCAMFTVEEETAAHKRQANVLATIVGYGTAFEPPDREPLLVHAHAKPIERAIRAALQDAGIQPSAVDLVATSFNGVPRFDAAEREALVRVFGERISLAAPKAVIGDTLGASGAFGVLSGVGWLNGLAVGPLVGGMRPERVRCVLVTAVGFYGNVSAVVLKSTDRVL